ncbi:hypothetical protein DAI22_11g154900 [Oryza sativa Japonica Group]|nr:hypothetical protein DAI22_11g154900 [Oryza sativa Japonica Group]
MDLDQPQTMPTSGGGGGGGDRLSALSDGVIGHILSFLPAKEAARAAVLSSRWRHTFAAVHTVSLVEPDPPVVDHYELARYSPGWGPPPDPNQPPPFTNVVSAALLARHRRAAVPPLRALHVSTVGYCRSDASLVDQWIAYAVNQADPAVGLDLDLRLHREPLCDKAYSLRRRRGASADHADQDTDDDDDDEDASRKRRRRWRSRSRSPVRYASIEDANLGLSPPYMYIPRSPSLSPPPPRRSCSPQGCDEDDDDDDDEDVISSDEKSTRGYDYTPAVHAVPSGLFSCAALRSLSLGHCLLAPPAAIALPSLETLLLARVSDAGSDVQRLISGCPRLADLTLEACATVTALTTVAGLRRLALRCCHALRTVAVDASPGPPRLQAFEYRGSVPDDTFLTIHGGASLTTVAYCKIDICGEEVTSSSELAKLSAFLRLFAGAKHLHLESARLGSGLDDAAAFATLPTFSALSHLELRGYLPNDDDDAIYAALTMILERAPNLETLSLVFHPEPLDGGDDAMLHITYYKEEELYDKHLLSYNRHSVLAAPTSGGGAMAPACLRRRVREINLVHYQGGAAQRTLAMYLLRSAAAIGELGCELAMGPLWIQDELARELEGWVMNKAAIVNIG